MAVISSIAPPLAPVPDPVDTRALAARYLQVRERTVALAAPLSAEDAMVQSMPEASPAKWHLAHTTWFFERFVLGADPGYRPVHPRWDYLFNSYYETLGSFHARPRRGILSRPSLEEVLEHRQEVDRRIGERLAADAFDDRALRKILLGTHHEQQHQELLLTDIKHAFWSNPLQPAYSADAMPLDGSGPPLQWTTVGATRAWTGARRWPRETGDFAYDNESPRHEVLLQPYALANRPVTHGEFRLFIED